MTSSDQVGRNRSSVIVNDMERHRVVPFRAHYCSEKNLREKLKEKNPPVYFPGCWKYSYATPNDHTTLQITSATTQVILAIVVFVINSLALCLHRDMRDKYENAEYGAKFSLHFLARSMGYASPVVWTVTGVCVLLWARSKFYSAFILSFSFYITGVSMTPILAMFMSKDAHFYSTHSIEARERAAVLRNHAAGDEEYEHHGSAHSHAKNEGDGEVGEHRESTHDKLITGAMKEEEFYESMETYALVVCAASIIAMVVIIAGLCGMCAIKRHMSFMGIPGVNTEFEVRRTETEEREMEATDRETPSPSKPPSRAMPLEKTSSNRPPPPYEV